MKARIENNLLIITLFNESEIRQAFDFQQANNYKRRSHELSIRFDIDLRDNATLNPYKFQSKF